jgi:CRISPR-associated protein Cas5t
MRSHIRYQRSLPLPPKTALCGLLGAALGYDEMKTSELTHRVLVGIIEESKEGTARDLWRISKFMPGAPPEPAVLIREYHVHPRYWAYYSAPDIESLQLWKDSFDNPFFPISLGASDDLCVVKHADLVELLKCRSESVFKNTFLPFNYRKRDMKIAKIGMRRGERIDMPQVFPIPTEFEWTDGTRNGINVKSFTYVPSIGVIFSDVQGAWSDGERSFFMF